MTSILLAPSSPRPRSRTFIRRIWPVHLPFLSKLPLLPDHSASNQRTRRWLEAKKQAATHHHPSEADSELDTTRNATTEQDTERDQRPLSSTLICMAYKFSTRTLITSRFHTAEQALSDHENLLPLSGFVYRMLDKQNFGRAVGYCEGFLA